MGNQRRDTIDRQLSGYEAIADARDGQRGDGKVSRRVGSMTFKRIGRRRRGGVPRLGGPVTVLPHGYRQRSDQVPVRLAVAALLEALARWLRRPEA